MTRHRGKRSHQDRKARTGAVSSELMDRQQTRQGILGSAIQVQNFLNKVEGARQHAELLEIAAALTAERRQKVAEARPTCPEYLDPDEVLTVGSWLAPGNQYDPSGRTKFLGNNTITLENGNEHTYPTWRVLWPGMDGYNDLPKNPAEDERITRGEYWSRHGLGPTGWPRVDRSTTQPLTEPVTGQIDPN